MDLGKLTTLAPLPARVSALFAERLSHLPLAAQVELAARLARPAHWSSAASGTCSGGRATQDDDGLPVVLHSPASWHALWEAAFPAGAVDVQTEVVPRMADRASADLWWSVVRVFLFILSTVWVIASISSPVCESSIHRLHRLTRLASQSAPMTFAPRLSLLVHLVRLRLPPPPTTNSIKQKRAYLAPLTHHALRTSHLPRTTVRTFVGSLHRRRAAPRPTHKLTVLPVPPLVPLVFVCWRRRRRRTFACGWSENHSSGDGGGDGDGDAHPSAAGLNIIRLRLPVTEN
ncbi:hypothetical protein FB451DRAFT_1388049 [Mycena latifolia]|nr:hypothetical protein FB451DRAFT_1388049 [Mycena latifolia]